MQHQAVRIGERRVELNLQIAARTALPDHPSIDTEKVG
jgi:hypothetical protein